MSIFSGREEAGNNPGNNLHVSGLSHRVDTRDLEQAFAKVGRVRDSVVPSAMNASLTSPQRL